MHPTSCLRVPTLFSLGCLLALAAGCSSEPAQKTAAPGHRHIAPPPMTGQEVFFDGKIGVDIKVGEFEGPAFASREASGDNGGGHRRGGGGGGGMGRGGRRHGGGAGESSRETPTEEVRPMMGSTQPPVMIHLQFTNHGPERVVLDIVDFVSALGNFAVQPERLTLEPGQSVETEPMSSRLTGALSETDATLALHIAGRNERKVIVLLALPGDLSRDAGRATDPGAAESNREPGTVQPQTVPDPAPPAK